MKIERQFSKFFAGGCGAQGHLMLHDREDMHGPSFTLGFTSEGTSSSTHLTPDGLRALVAAGIEALAALTAEPSDAVATEASAS